MTWNISDEYLLTTTVPYINPSEMKNIVKRENNSDLKSKSIEIYFLILLIWLD